MTVSYQYEVASSTSGGFTRLLFMWRGSLYKLIYRELVLFLIFFGAISAVYRHILSAPQKRAFEKIVVYCDEFISLIPLSFVLGFYVAYVAGRWWQQYTAIPWPDKVMHLVALYVTGNDEYGRMLRRALMRYLNLSLILVLRSISSAVKRRFPTLDHVVDSGFMTALELELFQSVPSVEFNTYWIPCTWFINLLKEARRSHRLPDAQGLKIIMEEFNDFRSKCGLLWSYDWVSIPLVYTQVVTLATYSFFAVALVGRQYIEGAIKEFQMQIDTYFPVFTVLQFFFFMGLLKVAEQLINPFGDDDEDFELNWLIDRHTKVSYLGVDTLMNRCPPLVKDIYYDSENVNLPYTEAAAAYKRKTYRGSVANMMVPEEKQTMFLPDITEEDEDTRINTTPRASTLNLSSNICDSPVDDRRQISGSPSCTPSKARNSSETIVPMDVPQEVNVQPDRARLSLITDAVRKLSGKSSFSDQNRKPFLALVKSAKVGIQPWPSATNLVHVAKRQSEETPSRRNSFNLPAIDVRRPSSASQDEPMAFVNTAFSQEQIATSAPTSESCDCDAHNLIKNGHPDVCRFQCRHENICQHDDDTTDVTMTDAFRPRLHSYPKHLLKKHRSSYWKRKGVRWKPPINVEQVKLRRRTIDSVPTAKQIVAETIITRTSSEDAEKQDSKCVESATSLDDDEHVNEYLPERKRTPVECEENTSPASNTRR